MWIKKEIDIHDLGDLLWSGAKEKWNDATDRQRDIIWSTLDDIFGDEVPEITKINDFIWFDCDDIFYPEEDEEEDNESFSRKRHCSGKQCKENVDGDKESVFSTIMRDKNLRDIAFRKFNMSYTRSRKEHAIAELVERVADEQGIMLDSRSVYDVAIRIVDEIEDMDDRI